MSETDPVEASAADDRDLYDVATWEPRSAVDRAAVAVHGALAGNARLLIVLFAALVFLAQVGGVVWLASRNPALGIVALLSAVPAFALVAFVWRQDVVEKEPLGTLAATFVLSVLFASFAATVNTALGGLFRAVGVGGMVLYFFLIVGPGEELVKWLAIRLYAFERSEFDAVIDGAVYGAVAGLGFATIENTLYVVQGFVRAQQSGATQAIGAALGTATSRALAGPGHVIYSAWAGYYLGLAKFNPENRGPIVVKGLLIAALIHALYNSIVTVAPLGGLSLLGYLGFVIVYDGIFFYLLYRKLARYRDTYEGIVDGEGSNDDAPAEDGDTESVEDDREETTDEAESEQAADATDEDEKRR
ncbi:PrsW family intramembrane metalloprotease [Halolamina sp. C58]|uniref:PrsW family intramembrane metalloprotease n=1 Tax=Halolamina sp. C58 TaxID=3421640 RepID=UPI003EBD6497